MSPRLGADVKMRPQPDRRHRCSPNAFIEIRRAAFMLGEHTGKAVRFGCDSRGWLAYSWGSSRVEQGPEGWLRVVRDGDIEIVTDGHKTLPLCVTTAATLAGVERLEVMRTRDRLVAVFGGAAA